ncbi:MAG: ATP-binding domain-containing protein, partial [Proteobacteria bacterium]|nr:ATP-binding domain-containing protein [Pseudomonadota bacterium]
TIHSAKGLEWRVVFIIWLVDGRFPPGKSFTNRESLEEELRLLYVAATRAKDKLIMVYPGKEFVHNSGGLGGNYLRGLSLFISALPQNVIKHHSFLSSSSPAVTPFASTTYTAFMDERVGVSPNNAILGSKPYYKTLDLKAADSSALKQGDRVNHPAFGTGVIAKFMGDDKVEVIFKDKGIKLLHLGYTSLEKI